MQPAAEARIQPEHPREDTAAALRTWAAGMLVVIAAVAAMGWIDRASNSNAEFAPAASVAP